MQDGNQMGIIGKTIQSKKKYCRFCDNSYLYRYLAFPILDEELIRGIIIRVWILLINWWHYHNRHYCLTIWNTSISDGKAYQKHKKKYRNGQENERYRLEQNSKLFSLIVRKWCTPGWNPQKKNKRKEIKKRSIEYCLSKN